MQYKVSFIRPNYQRFYKKNKKEEYACNGFKVIEKILETKKLYEKIKDLKIELKNVNYQNDNILNEVICSKCDFYIDGCDFRDANCNYDAPPCGGLIVISYLFEKGVISREEMENQQKTNS